MANALNDILSVGLTPAQVIATVKGSESNNTAGTVISSLSIMNSLASTIKNSPLVNKTLPAASFANNIAEAVKDINDENKNTIDDSTAKALISDALAIASLLAVANPYTAAALMVASTAMALASAYEDDSTDMSDFALNALDKIQDMANEFNLNDIIDNILNPTSQSEALPGVDDFEYFDPNNPTAKRATLDIYGSTVNESDGTVRFLVKLSQPINSDLTFNYNTVNGSATMFNDYAYTYGTVTMSAGLDYTYIDIPLVNDNIQETIESFSLSISAVSVSGNDIVSLGTSESSYIIDDDSTGDIAIEVNSITANEGNSAGQTATVEISISSKLSNDIVVSISHGGYVEIKAGQTSGSATITWDGDTKVDGDETLDLDILGYSYSGDESIVFGHGGSATILDDDNGNGHGMGNYNFTPPRRDPLVLDMDKDGFISTTSLEDSNAYFDLTGDGIKEKVGWIQANDGLVAYDKNDNGKIDGIDEVFGNQTTSGFDELRQIADSNNDGMIDRKDELFNRLKIWQDKNQDGISQTDELVGLKEAGVKSINLNAVTTNIDVNGNVITEASKYTDDENNLELAADLELEFDSRITNIDTSTIPDYTEHPESNTLPFLRGYGVVHDSNVAYNIDDNFRALALELASDVTKTANDFEEYMDGWSGYTKMQTDLQEKYGLSDTPKLSDLDRKVWTYEHFMGTGTFSSGIEDRLETTAAAMSSGGSDIAPSGRYNGAVVNSVYGDFTNRNKAFFSLKAFYPDVLSDAQYQRGVDEYVITDQDALNAKVSSYINNPDNSLEEKLYLVSQMNVLEGTFLDFSADAITSNIDDTLVKNLVTSIYNDSLNAHVYDNDGIYSNNALIVGNDTDEIIDANITSATVLAGKGDDKIIGGAGNSTYIYRDGDGADTIVDSGGSDTINFSDISHENVIIKSDGNDLIIAVAEDGKTFDELTNKVTISNWIDSDNRLENITFADGATPNFSEIINTHFISADNDNIDLTNSNDTVNMLDGDDTVNALGGDDTIDAGTGNDTINAGAGNDTLTGGTGNDTLLGGSGDDTYIFNIGDGTDTILDSSGSDTLRFGDGITSDNLAAKIDNGNLIIAIKEDGKTFDELADKITINNYTNNNNKIETIALSNGDIVSLDSIQATTSGDDVLLYGDNSATVDAGAGNDSVTTGSGADNVAGGEGNDTLNSGAGDDTVDAGAGDDYVNAGSGNDSITGGTGSDTLVGGLGNDTYIFNIGDGKDTIIDAYNYGYNNSSSKDAGNDTIAFGDGITKDDISVTIVGSDVVISINADDSITIKNAVNSNSAVENIQLSDGTLLSIQDLQQATENSDTLVFGNDSITLDALGGDDTITTGSGTDTIIGGSGNDTIVSQDGVENYTLACGNNTDYIKHNFHMPNYLKIA